MTEDICVSEKALHLLDTRVDIRKCSLGLPQHLLYILALPHSLDRVYKDEPHRLYLYGSILLRL